MLTQPSFLQDPAFGRVECKRGLFGLEALVHPDHAFELCDIGTGIEHELLDQCQNRDTALR